MINQTLILENAAQQPGVTEFISSLASSVFLKSIVFYWVFQFLVILILGNIFVKKDKGNFWAIFVFIQLIGAIILFFIFIYPIVPQIIERVFT